MTVDTLFTRARIFNPYIKAWRVADIAVLNGRILYIGNAASVGIETANLVDCGETTVIPGMIDIHLHIESSLCTPHIQHRSITARGDYGGCRTSRDGQHFRTKGH